MLQTVDSRAKGYNERVSDARLASLGKSMKANRSVVAAVLIWCSALFAAQQDTPSLSDELITESAQADVIRDVLVPVREPGVIEKMLVQEGDWVQAGQTIAELDRTLYEIELKSAEAKKAIAEHKATDDIDERYSNKSKEVAEKTLERSESAVDTYPNSITATELAQLKLELERATLSIEKAIFERGLAGYEAELHSQEAAAAEVKLEQRSIRSPIDGMVVEVVPQVGEWLNAGQTVARVVQLDRMRIKALIPADQIDQSFVGRTAVFESSVRGTRFQGTIHFVSPEVLPGTDKTQFWFDVDNPERQLRRREAGRVEILPRQ
jgi:multidrug efflux pump subunit AcrA (membrane-fusion protein)